MSAGVAEDRFVGRELASGKLRIEACVGVGGAGTVYRARHRDLQMDVAVKLMHEKLQRDPEFCKRFHAEALAASRLDHANLTRVFDFGQEPDGLLYLSMEFLDGRSVRHLLDDEKRLSFPRAAQIAMQVCAGLTHAHARNIVHRDIKPENLVLIRGLDEDGRETEIVKVCDFGIAHRSAVEQEAEFAGTAEYVSPEQFEGEQPTVQSDVYACGVVLYEMLVGVVPIQGEFPSIVAKVLGTPPVPPSKHVVGLDTRVDRLVMKALARDREIRHASARELRRDLQETAEQISLFSSGGYWEGASGNFGAASAQPITAAPPADGSPDWLERDPRVLASILPPSSSMAPQRTGASGPPRPPSTSQLAATRPPLPSLSEVSPTTGRATGRPAHGSEMPASADGIISGSHISMTPAVMSEADVVGAAVERFTKQLAGVRDPERFAGAVTKLPPKIRTLVEQGHFVPAWNLFSVLDAIAREPHGLASRAEHAQAALETFREKDLLKILAEKALDVLSDRDGAARKLVARGGSHAAFALYSARVRNTVFEARERFVSTLQEIGNAGIPTLQAGLEKVEKRLEVAGALWLAEDLLKAVPPVADEELGQVIARFARSEAPSLARLATEALPRVWGVRARSVLIGQMHHKDNDVAIAAMKRLRQLGGIDQDVIRHLRPLVVGTSGGRPAVRLCAIESLASATKDSVPAALALIDEILDEAKGQTPDVEDTVVMASSVLVHLGGDVAIVSARYRAAAGFMRTRLEAILRRARVQV